MYTFGNLIFSEINEPTKIYFVVKTEYIDFIILMKVAKVILTKLGL